MRIGAGKYKGRLLKSLPGSDKRIRPSSAKVKEAFFNIISAYVKNTNFLDLFSGTGSIGLEALSRGMERVVFVEKNHLSLKVLRKNIDLIGVHSQTEILPLDAKRALQLLSKKKEYFEVVYLDPPYNFPDEDIADILYYLYSKELVKAEGIIGLERSSYSYREKKDNKQKNGFEIEKTSFSFWQKKFYGNTILLILNNIKKHQ